MQTGTSKRQDENLTVVITELDPHASRNIPCDYVNNTCFDSSVTFTNTNLFYFHSRALFVIALQPFHPATLLYFIRPAPQTLPVSDPERVQPDFRAIMEHSITEDMATLSIAKPEQTTLTAPLLLRLPAELRIKIYELVLIQPFRIHYRPLPTEYPPPPPSTEVPRSTALALLEVCRQIYQETRLLPFQLNTIVLPKIPAPEIVYGGRRDYLRTYNRTLDRLKVWQMGEIRHLEVHTNMEEQGKMTSIEFFNGVLEWVQSVCRSENEAVLDL